MRVQHYQTAPLSASAQGYVDGLSDAREGRTPCHSASAYKFPRQLSLVDQRAYNDAYYEAQAKWAEASDLNQAWVARQNAKGWIEL